MLGTAPSTEKPYGPYPLVITPDRDPDGKVLVVQDYKYGKYLGRLNVQFDSDGKLTSWNGNPILLDNTVAKDPAIEREVQLMKAKMTEMVDVSINSYLRPPYLAAWKAARLTFRISIRCANLESVWIKKR